MNVQKPSPENQKTEDQTPPETKIQKEFGGFEAKKLPEPTRFGDWEVGGRCSDF